MIVEPSKLEGSHDEQPTDPTPPEPDHVNDSYNHLLSISMAKIVKMSVDGLQLIGIESEVSTINKEALSSLTIIAETLLHDLAHKSQSMAEVNQRTKVTVHDVMSAIVFKNLGLEEIQQHIFDRKSMQDMGIQKDSIRSAERDTISENPDMLNVGPVTGQVVSSHLSLPKKPDIHTFHNNYLTIDHLNPQTGATASRSTGTFTTQHPKNSGDSKLRFKYLREKIATTNLQNQENLTDLIAKSEYTKKPNVGAHAIFDGKEIEEIKKWEIDPAANEGEQVIRESCATKWEIHPLLLDDATDQNSYSPYASALTPTNSELQGLLKQDSHIPRKRPKKIDTNKHDKRRRQPGNNRQKTNR